MIQDMQDVSLKLKWLDNKQNLFNQLQNPKPAKKSWKYLNMFHLSWKTSFYL